jgi:Tfp pilus assembly protein PilN
MVQFNLLPDVKLEHVKSERTKRIVVTGALTLTALAVFIFVLLFLIVNVFQKNHLSNLNSDIKTKTAELQAIPDLDKVLTVQNQLNALTALHEKKPATSRIYNYLIQLTPKDAKVSSVELDVDAQTMTISGSAGNLETINRFADILKFTDYIEGNSKEKAFSEVVLSNFGVGSDGRSDNRTSYEISFKYNTVIFDNTKKVELAVPSIISTRSVTEKPTDLFEAKPKTQEGQQ